MTSCAYLRPSLLQFYLLRYQNCIFSTCQTTYLSLPTSFVSSSLTLKSVWDQIHQQSFNQIYLFCFLYTLQECPYPSSAPAHWRYSYFCFSSSSSFAFDSACKQVAQMLISESKDVAANRFVFEMQQTGVPALSWVSWLVSHWAQRTLCFLCLSVSSVLSCSCQYL